jgi:glutaminase
MTFVSTGLLPEPDAVQAALDEAYEHHRSDTDGEVSRVYPALARVPADLSGICVVGTSGSTYAVGDADHEFTIMSVSKPFVFALARVSAHDLAVMGATLADGGVNPITGERVIAAEVCHYTLAVMGTFAPPLDVAGNSVKGQRVARFLSARLGMDLLIF